LVIGLEGPLEIISDKALVTLFGEGPDGLTTN